VCCFALLVSAVATAKISAYTCCSCCGCPLSPLLLLPSLGQCVLSLLPAPSLLLLLYGLQGQRSSRACTCSCRAVRIPVAFAPICTPLLCRERLMPACLRSAAEGAPLAQGVLVWARGTHHRPPLLGMHACAFPTMRLQAQSDSLRSGHSPGANDRQFKPLHTYAPFGEGKWGFKSFDQRSTTAAGAHSSMPSHLPAALNANMCILRCLPLRKTPAPNSYCLCSTMVRRS